MKTKTNAVASNVRKQSDKNKPFDFILFLDVLILLGMGITMVLSASSPMSLSSTSSSYTYAYKQAIAAGLGLFVMYVISKIDYKILAKFYKPIWVISIVGLAAVLIPGIGVNVNGALRWIKFPVFVTIQPSEITKLGLIIFFAAYLTIHRGELKSLGKGFFKPLLLFAAPAIGILLAVQSHLSASAIIIITISVMMIMAGCKVSHFAIFGGTGAVIGSTGLYVLAKEFGIGAYRLKRLIAFANPWADPLDTGWQIIQGLYAIGSGGLFGVGLGNSRQKYLYISEPHNDYIFAVLAEELGFVGCILVIALFAIFIWRGILISMKAPDMFGSLLACGITALIGFQAIMNIAVVTSSIPVTGIALPFFSYGGTSLIILLAAVRSASEYLKARKQNLGGNVL